MKGVAMEFAAHINTIAEYARNMQPTLMAMVEEKREATIKYDLCTITELRGEVLDEAVKLVLNTIASHAKQGIPASELIERYCQCLSVDKKQLLEGSQLRAYADARKIIAWTFVRRHGVSQSLTAKVLGYSGNASVIKAVTELTNLYLTDMDFRRKLIEFCEKNRLESPVLM